MFDALLCGRRLQPKERGRHNHEKGIVHGRGHAGGPVAQRRRGYFPCKLAQAHIGIRCIEKDNLLDVQEKAGGEEERVEKKGVALGTEDGAPRVAATLSTNLRRESRQVIEGNQAQKRNQSLSP